MITNNYDIDIIIKVQYLIRIVYLPNTIAVEGERFTVHSWILIEEQASQHLWGQQVIRYFTY